MKTLKQIREEYDDNVLSLVEQSPEELMLEGSVTGKEGLKTKFNRIPSSKDMPVMLIFRRVSYRVYPNKQVVALYYSHMIDKYLSIPYGPGGNVNLSEATILDSLDEDWSDVKHQNPSGGLKKSGVMAYRRENPGSKLQTAVTTKPSKLKPGSKAANRRKSFCARMGGMKKRLTSAKTARDPDSRINKALRKWNCEESFQGHLNELRQERMDEFAPLAAVGGAIARSAVGQAVKSGVKSIAKSALKGAGKLAGGLAGAALDRLASGGDKSKSTTGDESPKYGGFKRPVGAIKTGTSWSSGSNKADASTAAKLKAADLAQARAVTTPQKVHENKMTDLRKMIKEGTEEKDININGKTITLNTSMAKRILEVYDSVNIKNKKIVEGMLNENLESFKKLLNFSIRN